MASSFSKQSINAEAALRVLEAARSKAEEISVPESIAVVDEAGNLKAFVRMDGASLISLGVAIDKAYTSAASGSATGDFFEFVKTDQMLLTTIPEIPRITPLGGGLPILIDGGVVGAIGVAGGHYSEDVEVAQAGIAGVSS